MNAQGSPYEYRNLQAGEIRLLRRLRGPSAGSPAVYLLENERLSAKPQYQALSYTWGSPFDTEEHHAAYDGVSREIRLASDWFALLDGIEPAFLDIGRNLFEGLEVFFGSNPTSYLWADALCINQKDLAERAAQVPLMESIYRQSELVFVWLGAGCYQADEIGRIIKVLEPLIPELSSFRPRQGGGTFQAWMEEHNLDRDKVCDFPPTVRQFVESTRWLRRAWVVQEVVSATSIRVQLGMLGMTWERFNLMLASAVYVANYSAQVETKGILLRQRKALDRINAVRADVQALLSRPSTLGETHDFDYTSGRAIRILERLLENTTLLEASEPQDRLYFAFGVFSRCLGDADPNFRLPTVSYTKDPKLLYLEMALFLLRYPAAHGGELFLFRMLGRTRGQRIGLPSWVPDYNSNEQSCIDDDFQLSQCYWAARVEVSPGINLYDAKLRIFGRCIMSVSHKIALDQFNQTKFSDLIPGTLGQSWLVMISELLQMLAFMQAEYENRNEALASVMLRASSPLGPHGTRSFFILISWMLRRGLSRLKEDADLHLSCLNQLRVIRTELRPNEMVEWLERLELSDDSDFAGAVFETVGGRSTALDAIYISHSGIIGRCGRDCQEGDQIWVAPGICCQYVFRPHGEDRYEVISQASCYPHHPTDILQGFKDDDWQPIQLI